MRRDGSCRRAAFLAVGARVGSTCRTYHLHLDHNLRAESMPVQRLSELAAQKCVQNVALLEDVGDTPFHILRPILSRMSARQLDAIELKSRQIIPHSDELWPQLVARDFPNRPESSRMLVDSDMPNKKLYFKYLHEREALQRDLAQRLRSMTARLRQEKSANAITPVKHLLRDPTIRRRPVARPTSAPLSSLSILQRARRETSERHRLLFNKPQKPSPVQPPKQNLAATMPHPGKHKRELPAAKSQPRAQNAEELHRKPDRPAETPPTPPVVPKALSPRKRPPSVFLNQPRKKVVRPPTGTKASTTKPKPQHSEVQAVRSSVFRK